MMTAEEIEATIEAWLNVGWRDARDNGDLFPDESKYPELPTRYGTTEITDLSDLQHYLQYSKPDDYILNIPGVGVIEHVEQFGGEGLGDDAWYVWKIDGRFFKKQGWHQSHYGTEYGGDFTEVRAVPVQRTEWQSV